LRDDIRQDALVRHLTPDFAVSALERGAEIEQFLGGDPNANPASIRWVTIYSAHGQFLVTLNEVEDVGTDDFFDVAEFPPLDPEENGGEGRVVATTTTAHDALAAAHSTTQALPDRWVNAGVVDDEYADYRRARGGR
jgi:hypothetical protein